MKSFNSCQSDVNSEHQIDNADADADALSLIFRESHEFQKMFERYDREPLYSYSRSDFCFMRRK